MDWKLGVVSFIKISCRSYIYFLGGWSTRKFIGRGSYIKKINAESGYKMLYGLPFKLFRFPNPVVELRNILIKSMVTRAI